MKIYTKTGDEGKTSLFDNTRVWKSHDRIMSYGAVDELNSSIAPYDIILSSDFQTRELSNRDVFPSSPVFVYIFIKNCN